MNGGGHDILEKASSTETLKHPDVDLGAAASARHAYVGPDSFPIVHLTYEQKESECLRREFQKYFDVEIDYVDLDSAFVTVKAKTASSNLPTRPSGSHETGSTRENFLCVY